MDTNKEFFFFLKHNQSAKEEVAPTSCGGPTVEAFKVRLDGALNKLRGVPAHNSASGLEDLGRSLPTQTIF